jgi:uncharacterized membrane protein
MGCFLCQFKIGALGEGFYDLLVSYFICPSFWCVSMAFLSVLILMMLREKYRTRN